MMDLSRSLRGDSCWGRVGLLEQERFLDDVLMNAFVVDCDGWRLDVCQVSVWEIHDDNGIVERIVVEGVDVVKLKDDGW